jgi:Family of unknown function (DUF6526)
VRGPGYNCPVPPTQNYANHVHRPTLTVVTVFFIVVSISGFVNRWRHGGADWPTVLGVGGLIGAVIVLAMISRAYTVKLQTRIIRLEMRVRGATFLTPAQQAALHSLDPQRVAALRFASDEEMPALLDRAVRESLSPKDIKKAVKNWVPDFDRT